MARVTIEDCLGNVKNRFELVLVASKRARDLTLGAVDACVPWENDKATVVALREIAGGFVTASILEESTARKEDYSAHFMQKEHPFRQHHADDMEDADF